MILGSLRSSSTSTGSGRDRSSKHRSASSPSREMSISLAIWLPFSAMIVRSRSSGLSSTRRMLFWELMFRFLLVSSSVKLLEKIKPLDAVLCKRWRSPVGMAGWPFAVVVQAEAANHPSYPASFNVRVHHPARKARMMRTSFVDGVIQPADYSAAESASPRSVPKVLLSASRRQTRCRRQAPCSARGGRLWRPLLLAGSLQAIGSNPTLGEGGICVAFEPEVLKPAQATLLLRSDFRSRRFRALAEPAQGNKRLTAVPRRSATACGGSTLTPVS